MPRGIWLTHRTVRDVIVNAVFEQAYEKRLSLYRFGPNSYDMALGLS
jgi:hypothetical protein